jgi:hypothetical protein
MGELATFYEFFKVRLVQDFDLAAEHCMPTLDYGEDCGVKASPYIGKCDFDGAGEALKVILGGDVKLKRGIVNHDSLLMFDQTPHFDSLNPLNSINDVGFVYIPERCMTESCRLVVAFHGCEQNLGLIGNQYASNSGFNEWAEGSNFVVLYPYVQRSEKVPYNPKGCWDWWAYSGIDYGLRTGSQIRFITSLIERITGRK